MISQEITHLHQNTDKGGVNLLSNSFKKQFPVKKESENAIERKE